MHHEQEGCCGGQGCSDHAQETADQLERAYWQALKELQVETLKAKLRPVWKKRLEAFADAVAETMEEEWRSFHRIEGAKISLKDRLQKIFDKAQ